MSRSVPDLAFTRRRWLLAGLAAAALGPRVARAGSEKVLVVGDSMIATALGQRIEFGLEGQGFGVARRGKSSSGLARPDFFDWMKEARRLVSKHSPAACVVMLGGNDSQSLHMGDGWIKWGEPGWRGEYASRVSDLVDLLSPNGQPVCWLGLPIARSPAYRRKLELINEIIKENVDGHGSGNFVSTWSTLTRGGEYTATMTVGGKEQAVRGDDGIHLTVAGANVLERKVRSQIVKAVSG